MEPVNPTCACLELTSPSQLFDRKALLKAFTVPSHLRSVSTLRGAMILPNPPHNKKRSRTEGDGDDTSNVPSAADLLPDVLGSCFELFPYPPPPPPQPSSHSQTTMPEGSSTSSGASNYLPIYVEVRHWHLDATSLKEFMREFARRSAIMSVTKKWTLAIAAIDLESNEIADNGAQWLSGVMATAAERRVHGVCEQGLCALYLASNEITAAGIEPLMNALRGDADTTPLVGLGLTNNPLGDEGIRSVVRFIEERAPRIRRLHLNHVGLSVAVGWPLVRDVVKRLTKVENVWLKQNFIGTPPPPADECGKPFVV